MPAKLVPADSKRGACIQKALITKDSRFHRNDTLPEYGQFLTSPVPLLPVVSVAVLISLLL